MNFKKSWKYEKSSAESRGIQSIIIWAINTFKIEREKGGPNNSVALQNCFPQEIRSHLFNLWKFLESEKSTPEPCTIIGNLMNDKEFCPIKVLKLKHRRGDQLIQPFCRIGSPQEIRSLLFNLWKFKKSYRGTPESCRMRWNLMNEEEFGSLKLLKLKYRSGDQIVQPFCGIGSPQEIRPPLFNLRKF